MATAVPQRVRGSPACCLTREGEASSSLTRPPTVDAAEAGTDLIELLLRSIRGTGGLLFCGLTALSCKVAEVRTAGNRSGIAAGSCWPVEKYFFFFY